MPAKIPTPCRKVGCAAVTISQSGYCDEHRNTKWEQHQKGLSRHQRGYGSFWDRKRKIILMRDNYLCCGCRKRQAETVDHIIPKARGGTDDDVNLQSLCWPCHRAKTARE